MCLRRGENGSILGFCTCMGPRGQAHVRCGRVAAGPRQDRQMVGVPQPGAQCLLATKRDGPRDRIGSHPRSRRGSGKSAYGNDNPGEGTQPDNSSPGFGVPGNPWTNRREAPRFQVGPPWILPVVDFQPLLKGNSTNRRSHANQRVRPMSWSGSVIGAISVLDDPSSSATQAGQIDTACQSGPMPQQPRDPGQVTE